MSTRKRGVAKPSHGGPPIKIRSDSILAWTIVLYTASAAFAGHGIPIVNVRTPEHRERWDRPEFVIASLGRWLDECSDEEADRVITAQASAPDPVVIRSIEAMEAAGLREQAAALRSQIRSLTFDDLRNRVATRLGFDPLNEPGRGMGLARAYRN